MISHIGCWQSRLFAGAWFRLPCTRRTAVAVQLVPTHILRAFVEEDDVFPLLVSNGIYHHWMLFFSPGGSTANGGRKMRELPPDRVRWLRLDPQEGCAVFRDASGEHFLCSRRVSGGGGGNLSMGQK